MNQQVWNSGKSGGGAKKKSVNSNRPPSGQPFSLGVSGNRISSAKAERTANTTNRKQNNYPNSYGGGQFSENSDFLPRIDSHQKSPVQQIQDQQNRMRLEELKQETYEAQMA